MRKIIVLVLIACLALSFTSCFAEEGKGDIQTEKRNVTSVEITLENWSTYFVLKEEPWWMENDFGEVDEMKLKTVIELRPEYYDRVTGESEIAFEVSGKVVDRYIDIDYSAKTYTLKEPTGVYEGDFKETGSLVLYEKDYDCEAWIYACHISKSGDSVHVLENAQVTRVRGTLNLYE